jgi:hypothetical protein
MMSKFPLALFMHMRIAIVLVIFFLSCGSFMIEQRAAIKFCVKLKETATETFEMFKSAYG